MYKARVADNFDIYTNTAMLIKVIFRPMKFTGQKE
jgi:hypothetical protein